MTHTTTRKDVVTLQALKRVATVGGLALLAWILLAITSTPANAQAKLELVPHNEAFCSTNGYTNVDGVSLDDGNLRSAVKSLEGLNRNEYVSNFKAESGSVPLADVRVLVLNQITVFGQPENGRPSVDTQLAQAEVNFVNRTVAKCNNMNTGGQINGDLMLVVVSTQERRLSLRWGENLEPWLGTADSPKDGVVRDAMESKFKAGEFTGGVADGLNKVDDKITYVSPWPGILRAVFKVVLVIAFLAAFGALAWLVVSLVRRAEQRKLYRKQVIDTASEVIASYTDITERLSSMLPFESGRLEEFSDDDTSDLRVVSSSLQGAAEQLTNDLSQLTSAKEAALAEEGSDTLLEELKGLADAFKKSVQSTAQKLDELTAGIDQLQKTKDELAGKFGELDVLRTDAQNAIAEAQSKGYRVTTFEASLAQAVNIAARALAASGTNKINEAETLRAQAEQILRDTAARALGVDEWHEELKARQQSAATTLADTNRELDDARVVFDRLRSEFHEDNWRGVAGSGSEAEERLNAVGAELASIEQMLSMENQEFETAETQLNLVDHTLSEARSFIKGIPKLAADLDAIKQQLPVHLSAVSDELDDLVAFYRDHGDDIRQVASGKVEQAISKAERDLAVIREAAEGDKLNYREVSASLRELDERLDDVRSDAEEGERTVEQTRRKVDSLLGTAQADLHEAQSYIQSHSSDSGSSPKGTLRDAERDFDAARSRLGGRQISGLDYAELLIIMQLLESSQSSASSSYSSARSAVRRADDAREAAEAAARRRRQTSSSSSSGSYGGFGSGGGGSFGSFGGGGGFSGGGFGGGGGGSTGGW